MKIGIEFEIHGCDNCPFKEHYRESNWSMDVCSLLPGPDIHSVDRYDLHGASTRPDCPLRQTPGPAQRLGSGATWRLLRKKATGQDTGKSKCSECTLRRWQAE